MHHGNKVKLYTYGIEWNEWWYLYWWNWLPKDIRFFGFERHYYEGPHHTFGFWFFNVSWRMPWTSWNP